ncbi:unnamed protein product, partial [Tilletia controversa]
AHAEPEAAANLDYFDFSQFVLSTDDQPPTQAGPACDQLHQPFRLSDLDAVPSSSITPNGLLQRRVGTKLPPAQLQTGSILFDFSSLSHSDLESLLFPTRDMANTTTSTIPTTSTSAPSSTTTSPVPAQPFQLETTSGHVPSPPPPTSALPSSQLLPPTPPPIHPAPPNDDNPSAHPETADESFAEYKQLAHIAQGAVPLRPSRRYQNTHTHSIGTPVLPACTS